MGIGREAGVRCSRQDGNRLRESCQDKSSGGVSTPKSRFQQKELMSRLRCKDYRLTNLFPARAVSVGCLYLVLEERGLRIPEDLENWLDDITSGKVDREDFEEVLEALKKSS